jgi:predicted RNase H-like nuclease (RuvC/YqgF family)
MNININNADSNDFSLSQKIAFIIEEIREMQQTMDEHGHDNMQEEIDDLQKVVDNLPDVDDLVTEDSLERDLERAMEEALRGYVTEDAVADSLEEFAKDEDLDEAKEDIKELQIAVTQLPSMSFCSRMRWLFLGR